MRPLTALGAGLSLLLAATAASASTPAEPRTRRRDPLEPSTVRGGLYVPDEDAPYGPYHIIRRPRGLPLMVAEIHGPRGVLRFDGLRAAEAEAAGRRLYFQRFGVAATRVRHVPVRLASSRGAALPHVRAFAARHGLGEAFVKTMVNLAKKEGEGGTFAVAARNFNAGCQTASADRARRCTPVDAPRAGNLITAWGVFQWNRDAGRYLSALDDLGLRAPAIASDWMPWDWSARQELELPIDYYAQLWRLVRRRGGTARDAARGVRLWHTGPTRFRRFYTAGADARAWSRVDAPVAKRIDRHLADAGVA